DHREAYDSHLVAEWAECVVTLTRQHEERGQRGREERAEERNDRHQAGEDSERQPEGNVEQPEADSGQCAEEAHRQQLTDDVRAKRIRQLRENVANTLRANSRDETR